MASPKDSRQSQLSTNELYSYEDDKCYICHGPETDTMPFIDPNPCLCKGSIKIHNCCIFPLMTPETNICCICKSKYIIPDGPIKWFYDNGNIRMEGTVKNDMYQGPKNWYYSDGSKRAEELCIDNERNGHCKYYRQGGILSSDEFYELGKRVGHSKFYFPDGSLWAEESHVNGLKDGLSKFRHTNGNLQCEENYKNGKLNGLSTFYHECGLIHCEIYYENDVEVLRRDHFVKPVVK